MKKVRVALFIEDDEGTEAQIPEFTSAKWPVQDSDPTAINQDIHDLLSKYNDAAHKADASIPNAPE